MAYVTMPVETTAYVQHPSVFNVTVPAPLGQIVVDLLANSHRLHNPEIAISESHHDIDTWDLRYDTDTNLLNVQEALIALDYPIQIEVGDDCDNYAWVYKVLREGEWVTRIFADEDISLDPSKVLKAVEEDDVSTLVRETEALLAYCVHLQFTDEDTQYANRIALKHCVKP